MATQNLLQWKCKSANTIYNRPIAGNIPSENALSNDELDLADPIYHKFKFKKRYSLRRKSIVKIQVDDRNSSGDLVRFEPYYPSTSDSEDADDEEELSTAGGSSILGHLIVRVVGRTQMFSPNLQANPFFHGPLQLSLARQLVLKGGNGAFLIRDYSVLEKNSGPASQFFITFNYQGIPENLKMNVSDEGKCQLPQLRWKFNTVSDMIRALRRRRTGMGPKGSLVSVCLKKYIVGPINYRLNHLYNY